MKEKLRLVGVVVAVIVGALLVLWAVHALAGNYLTHKDSSGCSGSLASHQVYIQNNQVNPLNTDGRLCDTMTITNKDNRIRLIAFGKHDEHVSYDGITEKALKKGESLTVELNQRGDFIFHDHFDDNVRGNFSVQ